MATRGRLLAGAIILAAIYSGWVALNDGVPPETQIPQGTEAVFYSTYKPDNCSQKRSQLEHQQYRIDPNSGTTIGRFPQWHQTRVRSDYFMFNLHTLRFLGCYIALAGHDTKARRYVDALIRDWEQANPDTGRISWPWSEHAAAWRSVVLGYFWLKAKGEGLERAFYEDLAKRHATFLSRPSVYTADHNHGINNALGLLALGVAFSDLEEAAGWRALAFARATQQINDNVSADGIHLEQSGYYHFYVLRSFMEIYRTSQTLRRSMPQDYPATLDAMLGAAARMAGADGNIEGLPYSPPTRPMLDDFLLGVDVLKEYSGAGLAIFNQFFNGIWVEGLKVYEQGGYSFFLPADAQALEVVFHTRILDAPHAHEDANGVAVAVNGKPLVIMPSTMHTGPAEWRNYFHSPAAHNTVMVDDLAQHPKPKRREGWLATFFDSYKMSQMVVSLGFEDGFMRFRRRFGLDRLPLRRRAVASGGEVLAKGEGEQLSFVTARHVTYMGVAHERTLARLGDSVLLVRDRLRSDKRHEYTQRFHFPPESRVTLEAGRGEVSIEGGVKAYFQQLGGAPGRLCEGELKPIPCGWYADSPESPTPTPAVSYRQTGKQADLLWILSIETASRVTQDPAREADVQIEINDCVYKVQFTEHRALLASSQGRGCRGTGAVH